MTQDEIIDMARKIATEASKVGPYRTWTHEHAMSLIMQLVDASAAKEREACAVVAEEWFCGCGRGNCPEGDRRAHDIADSIRARNEA